MGPLAAKLLVLAFLIPVGAVFSLAYRHALRNWLVRADEGLPTAIVASHHAVLARRGSSRRFHAVVIAAAFTSIFIMSVLAMAMIVVSVVAA